MKLNLASQNFRLFGPDETASNRLDAVYEASPKEWMARVEDVDVEAPSPSRVVKRRRTTRDPNVLLFGA
jgi:xylulose-5-phosphate/fructose-6-phosphate phosphoketolase